MDEINQIFGQKYIDISNKMSNLVKTTKVYFQNILLEIEQNMSTFNSIIKQYFKNEAQKYFHIFIRDNTIKTSNKRKDILIKLQKEVDSVNLIINLQNKMMESIKETINLYKKSMNIKIENGNLEIGNYYKNFLILRSIKILSNENLSYIIGPSNIYLEERKVITEEENIFLNKNYKEMEKINIYNININQDFFQNIYEFPKLKKLKYHNVAIKNKVDLNFHKKFSNLEVNNKWLF